MYYWQTPLIDFPRGLVSLAASTIRIFQASLSGSNLSTFASISISLMRLHDSSKEPPSIPAARSLLYARGV